MQRIRRPRLLVMEQFLIKLSLSLSSLSLECTTDKCILTETETERRVGACSKTGTTRGQRAPAVY